MGTPRKDVIAGLGGNDVIYSNGGRDVICVVLGDKDRWNDSYRLMAWALSS